MDGMILLGFILVAAIVLLPIIFGISANSKLRELKDEIYLLRKSFNAIYDQLNKMSSVQQTDNVIETISIEKAEPIIEKETIMASTVPIAIVEEVKMDEPPFVEIAEVDLETSPLPEVEDLEVMESNSMVSEHVIPEDSEPHLIFEPKPQSDIERFIGEKLLSLIGIGVFVLGIFFLVKWAIDQKLIDDVGKVSIGILSGIILISVAHRIRNSVRAFSSVLVGGGLAVLYFTIYIGFQDYHLIGQTPAFLIMVLITAFAVLLAIAYDKKELAVIAIIGGFTTPFWVSTGDGNYKVLFSYLLILNIGMFVLANFKKWNLINILSYFFTVLIFGGWMISKFKFAEGQAIGALFFGTLFYLIFLGMNLIYNIRNSQNFKPMEILMLLSNTFLYYSLGLYCLSTTQLLHFQGLFTICLGVVNFLIAFLLYKKENIDKNLVHLLIGLVLTFVSLSGAVQLEGNYITLFWAMEMVLLLWLGQKSGILLIKEASILVMLLTLISLIMDWMTVYDNMDGKAVLFNKAFITGFVVVMAFVAKAYLLKKDSNDFWTLPIIQYTNIVKIILILLTFIVPLLEIINQFNHHYHSDSVTGNFVVMYLYMFSLIAFTTILNKPVSIFSKVFLTMGGILIATYIFTNNITISLRNDWLEASKSGQFYFTHFITALLALYFIFIIGKYVLKHVKLRSEFSRLYAWFATITVLVILSCEFLNIWVATLHESGFTIMATVQKGFKIVLPILWGITSFVIMARGMHQKLKTLRIISLTLFTITLLKLFLYDISNATQGGKIVAFISLGILLLIVSFMYQKLKGMLIDEADNE